MKFSIKSYHAVAIWKWDTHPPNQPDNHKLYHYAPSRLGGGPGDEHDFDDDEEQEEEEEEEEDDVCGICRLAFESTCPECKVPGDDCPLIWGTCTHIFHMHCLLKWIETESSKGQCPMDRRPWETADRAPDRLPTTTTGEPVETVAPGPIPASNSNDTAVGEEAGGQEDGAEVPENESMEVDEGR